MTRLTALILGLLLPSVTLAATLTADESVDVSVSPKDNAYLAGTEVRVNAPLPADLLVAAGSLLVLAPVEGDALIAGGTIDIAAPIAGDVRAAGGRVVIEGVVGGDIAVAGGAVTIAGTGKEIRAAGGTVELRGGAAGPVTVYGGTIYLSGTYEGDVRVVASDHVTLGEDTVIKGTFEYNAPQEAGIPNSAVINGGVVYTGSSSFLPTAQEAETFALAGLGIFFVVRLVAGALAAGLLAGLFPILSRRIADETITRSWNRFLLLTFLGFAVLVVTPIVVIFLVASFVGIGIAVLLGAAYLLVLLLSYLYAAIIAGALATRFLLKRTSVSWRAAMLGMLLLYVIGLVPVIGFLVSFVLSATALGALSHLFYRFAFKQS